MNVWKLGAHLTFWPNVSDPLKIAPKSKELSIYFGGCTSLILGPGH